jgi:transcriptional regulator with XRE-family HTH domain
MSMREDMTTGELFKKLSTDPLEIFLAGEVALLPFHEFIAQLCRECGETREHIIKRSGIDRTYGHQLFNGTRKPSRDKVIQLAFGFGMDADQTQKLLRAAQKSTLYPRVRRDAAILYCIIHRLHIADTQRLLLGFHLTALGAERE